MPAFFVDLLHDMSSIWSFVGFLLVMLAIFGKWRILLMTLAVVVLGYGAGDLVIMNIESSRQVVTVPLLVYSVGGVLLIVLYFITFVEEMIR